MSSDDMKRRAAEAALEYVEDNTVVGRRYRFDGQLFY